MNINTNEYWILIRMVSVFSAIILTVMAERSRGQWVTYTIILRGQNYYYHCCVALCCLYFWIWRDVNWWTDDYLIRLLFLCCRFLVRPQAELCILSLSFQFVAMMVLIDSAWRELSIGGLIVNNFEYFVRCCHFYGCQLDCRACWPLSNPIFDWIYSQKVDISRWLCV